MLSIKNQKFSFKTYINYKKITKFISKKNNKTKQKLNLQKILLQKKNNGKNRNNIF